MGRVQKRIQAEQDLRENYLIRRHRELEREEGEERMRQKKQRSKEAVRNTLT